MKTKRIAVMILCLALLVVMGGEAIFSAFSIPIMATEESKKEIAYTNAYNDLISNQSFCPEDYPQVDRSNSKYYSLELITIAVSEINELFVYVYQPGGDIANIKASSIDISNNPRTDKTFHHYRLTYLNHYGVFYKYKVEDFFASWSTTGYYEISDILRPWSESYGDQNPGGGNTVSEKAFPVGKFFTISTGSRSVTVEDVEYITITNQFVGYIRYEDDTLFPFYGQDQAQDAHFVAFSTNRRMDELLEADVYYQVRKFDWWSNRIEDPWGEITDCNKYLDYIQKAECSVSDGSIFTSSEHIWKRIMTTSEFLSQEVPIFSFAGFDVTENIEFTDEAYQELAKTEWVLSFVETSYISDTVNEPYRLQYSRVGNVKIMRLKFKTDGLVYNLGVVGNMQTGSKDPVAVVEEHEWWQKIMFLLFIILIVLLFSFFQGPIGAVAKILWTGIKFLFKFLGFLILLPFRLLGLLFNKSYRRSIGQRMKEGIQNSKWRNKEYRNVVKQKIKQKIQSTKRRKHE